MSKINSLIKRIESGADFLCTFKPVNSADNSVLYVGTAQSIKAVYRSILHHSDSIFPSHCSFPRFTNRIYGLCIVYDSYLDRYTMYPVSSDGALSLIKDELTGYRFAC